MHIGIPHLVTVVYVDAAVRKVIVIDIRDVSDVGDPRIGDIHLIKIASAYAVPRDEWFTKAQWAPAEAAAETNAYAEAAAETNAYAESAPESPSKPCH